MEKIWSSCPDCYELVDKRGWNALHFAVNSSCCPKAAVQVILNDSSLSNLFNEKDADGRTPLHHHSKSSQYVKSLMLHNRVDKMAFNRENLNAYDIAFKSAELPNGKVTQFFLLHQHASIKVEYQAAAMQGAARTLLQPFSQQQSNYVVS